MLLQDYLKQRRECFAVRCLGYVSPCVVRGGGGGGGGGGLVVPACCFGNHVMT